MCSCPRGAPNPPSHLPQGSSNFSAYQGVPAGLWLKADASQVLMSSVMKPLRTIDSLRRGGWPFIDPHMLDLRHGEGSIDLASWPRSENKRPIFMHVAYLGFHYGPEVAASRQNIVWFRDVGGQSILGPAGASRFLEDLFRDLWIPQMVAFVRYQLRRDGHLSNSPELPEKLAMLEEWSRSAHPFSWT